MFQGGVPVSLPPRRLLVFFFSTVFKLIFFLKSDALWVWTSVDPDTGLSSDHIITESPPARTRGSRGGGESGGRGPHQVIGGKIDDDSVTVQSRSKLDPPPRVGKPVEPQLCECTEG